MKKPEITWKNLQELCQIPLEQFFAPSPIVHRRDLYRIRKHQRFCSVSQECFLHRSIVFLIFTAVPLAEEEKPGERKLSHAALPLAYFLLCLGGKDKKSPKKPNG
jgi:hypothetical protein